MDKIQFSVIIPLYNKLESIANTIDSVLFQTYPLFEIIIVDDGSTDGSAELVNNLNDSRIHLFRKENGGVSSARNKGIELANNELLAFIDADDLWDKDYLFSMTTLINKYPEISLYGTNFAKIKNGLELPPFDFFNSESKYLSFNLIEIGSHSKNCLLPINSSNFIIRKSIINKSGLFDTKISFFEDYDFFIRLSLYTNIAFLNDKPLSFYIQDSPINKRATGKTVDLKNHLVYHISKFDKHIVKNPFLKIYIDKFILFSLFDYRKCKTYKSEIKKLRSKVSIQNYSWKYYLLYKTPKSMASVLVKINQIQNNLHRIIIRSI